MKAIRSIIDCEVQNVTRFTAIKIVIKHYPQYSLIRSILKLINIINICTFQIAPYKDTVSKEIMSDFDNYFGVWFLSKIKHNKKLYLFHANKEGEYLVKIAQIENDQKNFLKEAYILTQLNTMCSPFYSPKIISYQSKINYTFIETALLPSCYILNRKKRKLPNKLFEEIRNISSINTIVDFDRDANLSSLNQTDLIISNEDEKLESINACYFAHGDLGSENLFENKTDSRYPKYALIDWEHASACAPKYTDEIGYWLGQNHKRIKRRGFKSEIFLQELSKEMYSRNYKYDDIMLALQHLENTGIDLARLISKNI